MTDPTPTYTTGRRGGVHVVCPCGTSTPARPNRDSLKCTNCGALWPTKPAPLPVLIPPEPSECESCGEHVNAKGDPDNHIRAEHPRAGKCVRPGCECPKWLAKGSRRERWAA